MTKSQFLKTLNKHLPTILTVTGIIGMGGALGTAISSTTKAHDLVMTEFESGRWDHPEKGLSSPSDVLRTTWKLYIPTAVGFITSAGLLVAANVLQERRQAAVMGLYALSETALRTYQNKVVDVIGATKEHDIRQAIAKDSIVNDPPVDGQIIITGDGDFLCKEAMSGRYFRSNRNKIERAENELNKDILRGEGVSVNDFRYALNLPNVQGGDNMGWNSDFGMLEFDITTAMNEEGEPCIVVGQRVLPNTFF